MMTMMMVMVLLLLLLRRGEEENKREREREEEETTQKIKSPSFFMVEAFLHSLASNPYFSAGFGLVGVGAALAIARYYTVKSLFFSISISIHPLLFLNTNIHTNIRSSITKIIISIDTLGCAHGQF
jgi:hypothetical protein